MELERKTFPRQRLSLQRHTPETIQVYAAPMTSRFNTENIDHPLDAEDCSCHRPRWLVLALAGLGVLGLIGNRLVG
jgi:hypothetical protein